MITFYFKNTFTKNVKDTIRVKNRSFYGFYSDPNFDDFWTNGGLFKKVRDAWNENKGENLNARVFLLRPGERPWKLIDSLKDDQSKIILWYLDIALYHDKNGIPYPHNFHDYYHIKSLKDRGEDVLVVLPDNDLDNCLTFEYVNTYCMADKVVEEQHNLLLDGILRLFENSKFFLRAKHFLSFNGHLKVHRIVLLLFIVIHKLFDKIDVSANSYHWDDDEKISNKVDVDEDILKRFKSMLPLNLDLKPISHQVAVKSKNMVLVDTKLNIPLYFNSYVDVVTNPNVLDNGVYIDEKIYKSFACLKPFLVVGQYKTLEVLRNHGFKTFDSIIDEGYDNEKDWITRTNMVCREMKRISELPLVKVDEMYWKIEDILKHNFFHLSTYVSEVDNKVIKEIIS